MTSAKSSQDAAAAITEAVHLASGDEPKISKEEALRRITPTLLESVLHAEFENDASDIIATGLGASPGAASGRIVLSADDAIFSTEDVILVREETSPADVHGMQVAVGILTTRGGLASHAAVVARGWGKPAVCGADNITIANDHVLINGERFNAGEVISIDGSSGNVIRGHVETTGIEPPTEISTLLEWADQFSRVTVRVNADTAEEARQGRNNGAQGIGLCRTEHMFLGAERLPLMVQAITAEEPEAVKNALDNLRERQREDFSELLQAMEGLPVTIRLLDPPLHEFLPDIENLIRKEALSDLDPEESSLLDALRRWRERNPMMGTRGVRLALIKPGLYEMQVEAILDAISQRITDGGTPNVEIMVPLTVASEEMRLMRQQIESVMAEHAVSVPVKIGSMIETPRAALIADQIAEFCDFLSFGTNDLTQMTFGFSRDDIESKIMRLYLDQQLLDENPFEHVDTDAVLELVRIGIERAKNRKPKLSVGICGEHGGDAISIRRLIDTGVDYVSCSPPRLPIARLAAGHAALN